jgi:glycosyltransferase involved in cell wall biosynthesis
VPAERLHLIGEAPDPVFRVLSEPVPTPRLASAGVSRSRRAVIYVGGFSPHKNVAMLIEAFSRLARDSRYDDVDLLLVGDYEHESFVTCYRELVVQVDRLDLGHRVRFTGFLPDEDLVVLLNLATVLALPSLTEGFGLPAVEAAACGCPVIATTESPLADVLGEAARYVDPRDQAALERALTAVLDSPELRSAMRKAGIEAARRLSWDAAARRLLSLIEEAAAS